MLQTTQRNARRMDVRMLTMADRLFMEFDGLPVKAVFDAISAARRTLRLQQLPATPEAIDTLARRRLHVYPAA